jgi:hypothetical protein
MDQKYGIYIPELKVFVYVNAAREEFEKMLEVSGIQSQQRLNSYENPCQGQERFDDFDNVIKEVSRTPFHQFCTELREIDF